MVGAGHVCMAKINIQRLKDFAFSEIPKDWPLREILITESEEVDVSTFLARLPVWLKLLRMERGRHVFSEK